MSLVSVLRSVNKGLLRDVLLGAGLTLGTSAVALNSINLAVNSLRSNLGAVSATMLNLMSLMGIDVAMSLILGAIVTRHTLQAGKITLQKIK